jgi:hypothetical protein
VADQRLSPKRAQILAHAIRTQAPYDLAEVADLLEALATHVAASEARASNAPSVVGGADARAALALLAQLPRVGP